MAGRYRFPPGPRAPGLWQLARWVGNPFDYGDACARKFGPNFTLKLPGFGVRAVVLVSEPALIRDIITATDDGVVAGGANEIFRSFLGGNSLLLLDGPRHRQHRKLMMPAFHGERMRQYGEVMRDITDASIDRWKTGAPIAMQPLMQDITIDVILRTIFGVEEDAVREELKQALIPTVEAGTKPYLLLPVAQRDWGRHSPWGRFVRMRAEADDIAQRDIAKRRAQGTQGRTDILSMLMEARDEDGRGMGDEELRDELRTLLVAGHETTATSLSWAIHWLLEHPEIARSLREEIDTVRGGAALDPGRVGELPLLDAFIKETMRLTPVVPNVVRRLEKPRQLGDYYLPANVLVAPFIYLAHRRPESFEDPLRFDPQRFIDKTVSPHVYFPFGGGARRCIGAAFAMFEMKVVLAQVLTRIDLRRAPDSRPKPVRRAVTIAPSDGVRVICTKRPLVRVRSAGVTSSSRGAPADTG